MLVRFALVVALSIAVGGCAYFFDDPPQDAIPEKTSEYKIGPGDQVRVFVWRNPELTVDVLVRPDGGISVPLLQDVMASGMTPSALADDVRESLTEYVQDPMVTIIVLSSVARSDDGIRVVGEAIQPRVQPYRAGLTLIDVMVDVGGLTEFADGNRSFLVRNVDGEPKKFHLRIADLLHDGDMSANVELAPGDVIRIPERLF